MTELGYKQLIYHAAVYTHPLTPHPFIGAWHESRQAAREAAEAELKIEPEARVVGFLSCLPKEKSTTL